MNLKRISLIIGGIAAVLLGGAFLVNQFKSPAKGVDTSVATAAGGLVDLAMTRVYATPEFTAGPSAGEIAATAAADAAHMAATAAAQAQSTQSALDAERIALAQAVATQDFEWTRTSYDATSQAASFQATQAYPATQQAYEWTQTAMPGIATANANQMNAQQTVVAGNAMLAQMSVRRQSQAWIGQVVVYFLMIVATIIVGWIVYINSKVRKLTPDGTVHLIDNGKAGGQQLVNASLMSTPVTTIRGGQVAPAGMVDKAFQEQVTRRAQNVQALQAVASGPAPAQNTLDLVGQMMGTDSQRFGLGDAPGELSTAETAQKLVDDWKASHE